MDAVCYSLRCDDSGLYERQWTRSIRSLRRHNSSVDVVLCLFGAAGSETLEVARAARVHVERMGDAATAFRDVPVHWRKPLSAYAPLHKFHSLCRVASMRPTRLLYLDCDTYVFGDVATLLDRYSSRHWYAREEPNSRRNHQPYDRAYLDEDALARLAHAEGLAWIPPYNTGVAVIDGGLAASLATLRDDFHRYAWRLLLGACLWRPDVVYDPEIVRLVRQGAEPREHRLALPFPSGNDWILDQLATWLTLGRVTALTHDLLRRRDVVQNGEYADEEHYVVAHYFTGGEDWFLAHLERLGEEA